MGATRFDMFLILVSPLIGICKLTLGSEIGRLETLLAVLRESVLSWVTCVIRSDVCIWSKIKWCHRINQIG